MFDTSQLTSRRRALPDLEDVEAGFDPSRGGPGQPPSLQQQQQAAATASWMGGAGLGMDAGTASSPGGGRFGLGGASAGISSVFANARSGLAGIGSPELLPFSMPGRHRRPAQRKWLKVGVACGFGMFLFMVLTLVIWSMPSSPRLAEDAVSGGGAREGPVHPAMPQQPQQPQQQQQQQRGPVRTGTPVSPPNPTAPSQHSLTAEGSPEAPGEDAETLRRREAIREAFRHSWGGYKKFAWGRDEIRPVTNETNDSWGGYGATLVDGLDTAMLMGLDEEIADARRHIESIDWAGKDHDASFFEVGIRYLGGLLGAYSLSPEPVYLRKAEELAQRLMPAFDTPSGLPRSIVNLRTGASRNPAWTGRASILSEIGSIQLEFAYLSHLTGNPLYHRTARRVYSQLDAMDKSPYRGLYPVYIDESRAEPRFASSRRISWGSLADSFYEYLLKLWLLSGGEDRQALRMFEESTRDLLDHLVHTHTFSYRDPRTGRPAARQYSFVGELSDGRYVNEMEHLTCFVPGLLNLYSILSPGMPRSGLLEAAEVSRAGTALVASCASAYFHTATGVGPESVRFHDQSQPEPGAGAPVPPEQWIHDSSVPLEALNAVMGAGGVMTVAQRKYILRPETLESVFMQYRKTGDPVYREWGWNMFQAIDRNCRTRAAFSGLVDVVVPRSPPGTTIPMSWQNWDNSMQSFWVAETLKYLYLLFSPADVLPLDQYVFNTEAHPFRVMSAADYRKIGGQGDNAQ